MYVMFFSHLKKKGEMVVYDVNDIYLSTPHPICYYSLGY